MPKIDINSLSYNDLRQNHLWNIRYTEPEPEQALLLEKLDLTLPQQPPPKIYASQLAALEGY